MTTEPDHRSAAPAADAAAAEARPGGARPLDARLLAAMPLDAREVAFWGAADRRLAAAYLARNPKAATRFAEDGCASDADVAVFEGWPALAAALASADLRLAARGVVVARIGADQVPAAKAGLASAGFVVLKGAQDADGLVLAAGPRDAGFASPLHLEVWIFAPTLMDVRTRLPTEQLNSDPRLGATCRNAPFQLPKLPLDAAKVLVLQRPASREAHELSAFLAPIVAAGWVPVIETDDHPALIAQANSRPVREIDWLKLRAMFAVQTSTPALAEAFAPHNPEVKVFPNAVFDLPPPPDGRPRRVFYGAVSRGPLAVQVARALTPAIRDHPDLEFLVVGDRAVFDALATDRKRLVDYMPYADYLAAMQTCSLTLSPLEDRPYTATKSDAKYLDAAACGALLIASPTVYGASIAHGVNGLIADRVEDWAHLVSGALADEPARLRMVRRAWDDVRETRMFADQIPERRAWYRSLWARRAELEAAACARLPGLAADIARARSERASAGAG